MQRAATGCHSMHVLLYMINNVAAETTDDNGDAFIITWIGDVDMLADKMSHTIINGNCYKMGYSFNDICICGFE